MTKVLIIAPSNKGTIALRSMDLYKAFALNHEIETKVIFLHKYADGFNIKEYEYCDVYNNSALQKFLKIFKEVSWVRKKKREYQPDITISTLIACSVCSVLSFTKDFKIGLFRAPYEQIVRAESLMHRLFHPWIFSRLDRLVGVSEEVTKSMQQHFPKISTKRFSTIYNAFYIDDIRQKMEEPLERDEKVIFEKPTILYVCRLNTLKAPQRLIHAMGRSDIKERYNLVFVGADTENRVGELTQICQSYGIEDRVFFLGAKKNPYKYMKRAKYFASSSITEGLPGVIIESLIVGTPVITTNCSYGVWEILSCTKDYQKDLKELYVAANGIITANTTDEEQTIESLKNAFNAMEDYDFRSHPFDFESRIKPEDIVNAYMNLFTTKE